MITAGFTTEQDARQAAVELEHFCEVVGPRWGVPPARGYPSRPWTLLIYPPETSLSQLYLNPTTVDQIVDVVERHDGLVV